MIPSLLGSVYGFAYLNAKMGALLAFNEEREDNILENTEGFIEMPEEAVLEEEDVVGEEEEAS